MTATTPTDPPSYPHCGFGADAEDPAGCLGHLVPRPQPDDNEAEADLFGACLTHLDESERGTYLASLRPGSDIDHRGTTFNPALLADLLDAVRDSTDPRPRFGTVRLGGATFTDLAWFDGARFTDLAWFDGARFTDLAWFDGATFTGGAGFHEATFEHGAWFDGATFTGGAVFDYATFERGAWFDGATFTGGARFNWATFTESAEFDQATFKGRAEYNRATFKPDARFDQATFERGANFDRATFEGIAGFDGATFKTDAEFNGATFEGIAGFRGATFKTDAEFNGATFKTDAEFDRATFEKASSFGPLMCQGTLSLAAAVFSVAVTVEIAASRVDCRRTRWASTASLRLRHAVVDFSDAVLEFPVSVTAHPTVFTTRGSPLDESELAETKVRVASLRGVDAAHLVLTNLDLGECLFCGTVHLDQLRLEGRCAFPLPNPQGIHWRRGLPVRHTQRLLLAEEQHWRHSRPRAVPGWLPAPPGVDIVEPPALAGLYRALRKSHEDSRNEPGATDFYYGEMEMRRADPTIAPAERGLLNLYWALSGYGLRAARAVGWLLCAMTATVLLMVGFGLPDTPSQPYPPAAGVIGKQNPQLHADFPDRFTVARTKKAADVVINSVIFRSSGQHLTTAGRYTEMASRFTEPILLALALLAVRGRVKR